ncbi:MAG: nucleoside recognition protein [Clostridiales bacterium]|jgi:spore maturation protein A|nr:nucleoside recognition protein [Clostridiales bacterium]
MLNYIWGAMILTGIVVAAFTGNIENITNAAIESSKEAVTACITMLGVVSMWTGLVKIAEKAGIVDTFTKKLAPVMRFLFPDLPVHSKAVKYISTNMIANVLGLGWAATPAGLMAMDELQKMNRKKDTASNAMCMFMIINMSSLQIVTISVISDRAMYNSANPSEVIFPGILATLVSSVVAVVFAKICQGVYRS